MDHLDPKYRRWMHLAERGCLILVLLLTGASLGYMAGVQGSDARVAAADKRLVDERADRLSEITRLQESNSVALGALSRLSERTARKVEKAADTADTAAQRAETAAGAAKGAASRAQRSTPTPAPAVNETVRNANRQLGVHK